MKSMKSMTEFVLSDDRGGIKSIEIYAKTLKTEPQLWMFVRCDEKGELMEIPAAYSGCKCNGLEYYCSNKEKWEASQMYNCSNFSQCFEYKSGASTYDYNQAKARCWFEGAELDKRIVYMNGSPIIHKVYERWTFGRGRNTIEDIISFGIELTMTETLIKKLGL